MKALNLLRALSNSKTLNPHKLSDFPKFTISNRFYSAEPVPEPVSEPDSNTFDSSHYELGSETLAEPEAPARPTWEAKYRKRANKKVFGVEDDESLVKRRLRVFEREEEKKKNAGLLARELLQAALVDEDEDESEDEVVRVEDQMSLSVGIIGAPNAGKSALTNFMVGTKVAAVSRKTNTTTHEVLGVMTRGKTQICFFDTPGLILRKGGYPKPDMKVRVESAWSSVDLYDVLVVIFDVHRHLTRPDNRVIGLIKRMGSEANLKQKRILCMNKVDMVEKPKKLLKVTEEFKDLPGYERHFQISGLKGYGVNDLTQYLMDQAVQRPWDEEPLSMTEEVMKNISLEIVRERLLDHVHQEIPYEIEHRLVNWEEMRDGSVRIEQHLITNKLSQRKILVGKRGAKIGKIGVEANEELRAIFKRNVHLILMVRLK